LKRYKLFIRKKAHKTLQSYSKNIRKRIKNAIDILEDNPRHKGIRKLVGSENLYRLRVGIYRVIYSIDDDENIIEVLTIDKRSVAYRDL